MTNHLLTELLTMPLKWRETAWLRTSQTRESSSIDMIGVGR